MSKFEKKIRGFTLIETIIALAILAMLGLFLLPALGSLIKNSDINKDKDREIYALETAIELEKLAGQSRIYGEKIKTINGYEIIINRSKFSENLDKIQGWSENYDLEVLEVVNEKIWFHPN